MLTVTHARLTIHPMNAGPQIIATRFVFMSRADSEEVLIAVVDGWIEWGKQQDDRRSLQLWGPRVGHEVLTASHHPKDWRLELHPNCGS